MGRVAAVVAGAVVIATSAAPQRRPLLITAVRESPYATRAYVLRDGRLRVLAEGRFLTAHIAAGGRRVGFVEGGLTRSRLVVAATTTGHRHAIVRVDAYPMAKAAHSTSRGRQTESGSP